MKKLISISFVTFIIDRLIKFIIIKNIPLYKSIKIINKFFYLTYVRNYGAAWSLFKGARWILVILAIIVLILIYLLFIKNKKLNNLDNITYGLLIGGIIGNLIDRIIYGYVIDYLDFYIFKYDYPIFNLADIAIVISIFILIIMTLKGEENDNSR